MNNLKGHIVRIESIGSLSMVRIALQGEHAFKVMVIDTPKTRDYLQTDRKIDLLFKETEVVLSTANNPMVSIENQLPCTVKALEQGTILTRVLLESTAGKLAALLPTSAVLQMNIMKGHEVLALVKFNEIMLSAQ